MTIRRTTLGGHTHEFPSLSDLLAKATPARSGDVLAGVAAESQARSGHDIFAFPSWQPHGHAESLAPVNDIMDELIKQNGAVNETVTYLGKLDGKWLAVPATPLTGVKVTVIARFLFLQPP